MSATRDPPPYPLPRFASRPPSSRLAPLTEELNVPPHLIVPVLATTKPRRPRKTRTSIAWDPTLDIYHDETTVMTKDATSASFIPSQNEQRYTASAKPRRSSLFSQPAQKVALISNHGATFNDTHSQRKLPSPNQAQQCGSSSLEMPAEIQASAEPISISPRYLKKVPRRRTMYIPSNDTTITSIIPAASLQRQKIAPQNSRRSEMFLNGARPKASESIQASGQDGQRTNRRTSLLAAPRKPPLRHVAIPLQHQAAIRDVAGRGGGKENIPPGSVQNVGKPETDALRRLEIYGPRSSAATPRNDWTTSPRLVHKRAQLTCKRTNVLSHAGEKVDSLVLQSALQESDLNQLLLTNLSPPQSKRTSSSGQPRSLYGLGRIGDTSLTGGLSFIPSGRLCSETYPIIATDVSHPELYEDNWLSYQEAAISEIVNRLFESHDPRRDLDRDKQIQKNELSQVYCDPNIALLHRRLQASLRFGALSISKNTLEQVGRFRDDLQQRQRFLDLWTKTYNLEYLQAAAEMIVGRTIPADTVICNSPRQTCHSAVARPLQRAVEEFLSVFLVRNEDCSSREVRESSPSANGIHDCADIVGSLPWIWRRTVIRSLMIVLLLDRGKREGILRMCIFQPTSPFKSSAAVIQALGNLLLPSIGNIHRVLDHLSYQVLHVQHPLEERTYEIENLAVDLRDGILLTRLVEILLNFYSPTHLQKENIQRTQPCRPILYQDFCRSNLNCHWMLSQHLKLPCASRAQKLYNVQIALSGLQEFKCFEAILNDVKAGNIVDGHREKSLDLLWCVIGQWGLDALFDLSLVTKEISRLDQAHWRTSCMREIAYDNKNQAKELIESTGLGRSASLLKSWAQRAASSNGVDVSNLSTSFSDGRAYRAIIAEYSTCNTLLSSWDRTSSNDIQKGREIGITDNSTYLSFETVLSMIQCPPAFEALIRDANTIQSSKTTIVILAFLASRLLPKCQPYFAALSIQRAWRRRRARRGFRTRLRCALLARECATVVMARERIVHAATILQRWWRRVVAMSMQTPGLSLAGSAYFE